MYRPKSRSLYSGSGGSTGPSVLTTRQYSASRCDVCSKFCQDRTLALTGVIAKSTLWLYAPGTGRDFFGCGLKGERVLVRPVPRNPYLQEAVR